MPPDADETGGLARLHTLILAAAAGLSVANVYAAQPLLDMIAQDFGLSPGHIGLVVTLTQAGYGLGLIFLVPLGDLLDRRRLILWQGLGSVAALIVVATARTVVSLFLGLAAMGCLAVLAQVIVAFAAALAAPAARGRTVGAVTSGIVIGILAARFVAGVLADHGGWRMVYVSSAVLTLLVLGLLARTLPRDPPGKSSDNYWSIVRSIPRLFLRDPVLLGRALLALLSFAAFSTFWTVLVLPLRQPPFSYSHGQIGLFGLVGMAGAIAAAGAGALADRGLGRITTGGALIFLSGSWLLMSQLPNSIPALVGGVIFLDLAVQAIHVTNQNVIFSRHPDARSRLAGGYMLFYSVGSALGAISSTQAYAQGGWLAVCILGASFSLLGLIGWAATILIFRLPDHHCQPE
jgi:predicted MFS family arabinose efflux permease